MAPHDILYRYTASVETGSFDGDLGADERASVVRLLRVALRILEDFGGTPGRDLARMVRDPQEPPEINDRVREIIAGCLPA